MPTTPQDHKVKETPFTFEAGGKKYRLPKVTEQAALDVPGGVTADAIMYPEDSAKQVALVLHMLNATKPDAHALAALRSLSTEKMLKVAGDWMGEGSGSSE